MKFRPGKLIGFFLFFLGVLAFFFFWLVFPELSKQTIETVGPITDFTLIVLPDTQFYSAEYPEIFVSQTEWIVESLEAERIVFVSHTGDIVNSGRYDKQWERADAALGLLDEVVAYGLLPGNHDDRDKFSQYFPDARYENRPWWGGHYGEGNKNNYQFFSAGGMDFLILHLEHDPSEAVLEWADKILKRYPQKRAIVSTHYLLDYDGFHSLVGRRIFKALSDNLNLFLMLCSHIHTEVRRTDVVDGRPIYQLLANYQTRANGGNGWLRILRFVPKENKIYIKTYSPYLDEYEVDENSQFELSCEMRPSE